MKSRVELTLEKKKACGYNCAQAVACTYCDLTGISESDMSKLNQGFGGGTGGSMEGTCGAIVGAVTVVGMICDTPQKTMQASRNILTKFKNQNGTVICRELKGVDDGVMKRSCPDCIMDAAKFLEEEGFLNER